MTGVILQASTWTGSCLRRWRLTFAGLSTVLAFSLFFTAAAAEAQDASSTSVTVADTAIRIDGGITSDSANLFAALMKSHPELKTVSLNSPGGRVFPALEIARTINASGLMTSVPSGEECYSACALIFLAGKERVAQGKLGVHQVSGVNDPSLTQTAIGRIYEDLVTFNAPSYLVSRMLRTPPSDMYVFSPEELERNSINIRDASKAIGIPHLLAVETWLRQSWLVGVFINTHTNQPFVALESSNMEPLLRIAHYPHRSQTFVEIMVPEGSISGKTTKLELRFAHGKDQPFSIYVNADIESNAYAFDLPVDPVEAKTFWAAFNAGTQLTIFNSFGAEVGRYSLAGSRAAIADFMRVASGLQ
ncbi:hypothetical protein BJF92_13745 [Rhizobium rhizosphaerae]|uniref:Uncharacterized protein n=1 Tax=Xaviernesmea rhizosphaerae TaxID=1672749 RepID=A0A1Q9AI42_9HYPH|nr:hypothetical protein [Xaviernesmea rhizosphaerae]OLP54866.1 hypothetical protein BJF92_13745 [Xaviernesmea rhizosphaerae]